MRTLLLTLLLIVPVGIFAQDRRALIAELKETSVTIDAGDGYGSGSIITPIIEGRKVLMFISAAHVMDDLRTVRRDVDAKTGESRDIIEFKDARVISDIVVGGRMIGSVSIVAKVVYYSDPDNGYDFALLLARRLPHKDQKSTRFYLGDKIPYTGVRVMHVGSLYGPPGSGSFSEGVISKIGRIVGFGYYDQTSTVVYPGSSGGGIYNNGLYVGMAVRWNSPNFNLMTPVRRLREWSRKANMEWVLDPSKPTPTMKELKTLKFDGISVRRDSKTGKMSFTRPNYRSRYEPSKGGSLYNSFLIRKKKQGLPP